MFARTRLITLAGAAFVLTTAAGTGLTFAQKPGHSHQATLTTTQADLNLRQMSECHLYRRAISRVACRDRLLEEAPGDTAEN
jgi:hypothetical protein